MANPNYPQSMQLSSKLLASPFGAKIKASSFAFPQSIQYNMSQYSKTPSKGIKKAKEYQTPTHPSFNPHPIPRRGSPCNAPSDSKLTQSQIISPPTPTHIPKSPAKPHFPTPPGLKLTAPLPVPCAVAVVLSLDDPAGVVGPDPACKLVSILAIVSGPEKLGRLAVTPNPLPAALVKPEVAAAVLCGSGLSVLAASGVLRLSVWLTSRKLEYAAALFVS